VLEIGLAGQLATERYRLDLARQPLVTPEQATVSVTAADWDRMRATGPVRVRGNELDGAFPLVRSTRIVATEG
jgi:hypothetical protein